MGDNDKVVLTVLMSILVTFILLPVWISLIFFSNCGFYKLLRVQHSSSSTPTWGSVLPFIVETRDQISRVAPFSLRIGIWDLCVHRGQF